MNSLVVIRPTDSLSCLNKQNTSKAAPLKRKKMSSQNSRKDFKKKTGIHSVNKLNPRKFRGGIRL
ncbi:putative DNA binding protein [Microviridae sp.]|nr:putative DNA binding protein [Microviridae sp.]